MIKQSLSKLEICRNILNLLKDVYTTKQHKTLQQTSYEMLKAFPLVQEKDKNACYIYFYFTLLKVPASNEGEMKQIGKEEIIIIQI